MSNKQNQIIISYLIKFEQTQHYFRSSKVQLDYLIINQKISQFKLMSRREGLTIEEILAIVERPEEDNQYTSLRISEDYQPYSNRYSKEDEYQELDLILEDDQKSNVTEQELEIKEQSSKERIKQILEESKQDAFKKCVNQSVETAVSQEANLNQGQSAARFKSKKPNEGLRKRSSLKKETDELSKKYDDIFNEIFGNSKPKEEKKQDPITQAPSLTMVKEDSLVKSNTSTDVGTIQKVQNQTDVGTIQKVQNQIGLFAQQQKTGLAQINQVTPPTQVAQIDKKPKAIINYQPLITINVIPPTLPNNTKSIVPLEEITETIQVVPKKQIKFSYGKTINFSIPVKKQSLIEEFIDFNQSQQTRLPVFLRNLRNGTSSFPNFYNKQVMNKQNCQKFNAQIYSNFIQCKFAINALKECHLKIHELAEKVRLLYKKLSQNILLHKSVEDQQLLTFFMSEEWPNYVKCFEIRQIQPHSIFMMRPFNELQFFTSLQNYEEIIYSLLVEPNILNLQNLQSVKEYMSSRDRLWAVQKNLRMMSEELYLYALKSLTIPGHIQQSYNLLKRKSDKEGMEIKKEQNILLSRLLFLQQKKDLFSSSWLGNLSISILKQGVK